MRKNKRIIAIFLSLMMLISSGVFVNNAHAAQAKPTVYAHSYTVMDANSGEIIISEQENKRIYPASTIKLLTAIVAIENCSLYKSRDDHSRFKARLCLYIRRTFKHAFSIFSR